MPPSAVPKLTPTRCCGCLARPGEARVFERHARGRHGELRVTIEPLQAVRREMVLRHPIADLAAAMRVERCRIEAGDMLDAALLREDAAPESVLPVPMQVIGPMPVITARRCFPLRIDQAASWCCRSRCAFMQRNVWPAM
jgi:hypothetical protein